MRYYPAFPKTPGGAAVYLILASILVGIAGFAVLNLAREVFDEVEAVAPSLLAEGIRRPWLIAATAVPSLLWGLLLFVARPPGRGLFGFLLLLIPIAFTFYAFAIVIRLLYNVEP